MSRKLMEVALGKVRKRFLDNMVCRLERDSGEHDLVKYRAKTLFDKTVMGGKNARSLLCLSSFQSLHPSIDDDTLDRVSQVAATLEMVQAFYLIADDIMDESDTRRGEPCWYKRKGIGLSAINDAFLLDSIIEDIVRQLVPGSPNIDRICEAFRRSKRITLIGQLLDTSSQHNLESFSWERYEQLVQHKTSHYTYFHPVETALLLSDQLGSHPAARQSSYQIGFLFQSQDDVLDVFGDPSTTGKIGTDLKDGKCTWVTVRAIQKMREKKEGSDVIMRTFTEHFGKSDESSLATIRSILDELKVADEFRVFEQRFAQKIHHDLSLLPSELQPLSSVFQQAVSSIVNRNK